MLETSLVKRLLDALIFDPFWSAFYHIKSNRRKFELSCFPFPLKLNCVGCYGCAHNYNPFLSPPKPKGPYKVFTSELFNEQYAKLFGKGALVHMLYEMEKHNEEIDDHRVLGD